jgi:hypothetical protein
MVFGRTVGYIMTRFVAGLAISLSLATPSFAADTLADALRIGVGFPARAFAILP